MFLVTSSRRRSDECVFSWRWSTSVFSFWTFVSVQNGLVVCVSRRVNGEMWVMPDVFTRMFWHWCFNRLNEKQFMNERLPDEDDIDLSSFLLFRRCSIALFERFELSNWSAYQHRWSVFFSHSWYFSCSSETPMICFRGIFIRRFRSLYCSRTKIHINLLLAILIQIIARLTSYGSVAPD